MSGAVGGVLCPLKFPWNCVRVANSHATVATGRFLSAMKTVQSKQTKHKTSTNSGICTNRYTIHMYMVHTIISVATDNVSRFSRCRFSLHDNKNDIQNALGFYQSIFKVYILFCMYITIHIRYILYVCIYLKINIRYLHNSVNITYGCLGHSESKYND